jgi:trans-2,3-dihydro-3-hydroxyanthranilate isomerase
VRGDLFGRRPGRRRDHRGQRPVAVLPHPFPYTVLDVFTDRPLAGNALAVVQGADGVDDATMGAFARETRLSETTFVQAATVDGADYRNRIWTVGGEVPFAGHPSLGTAVAVAHAQDQAAASYVQQTEAGSQPIDVRRDGDVWHASMLQEQPVFEQEAEAAHVMAAAGLMPGDAHPELPPQAISTGLMTLVAPVRSPDAIARARPDLDLVRALLAGAGAESLYLIWHEDGGVRARMFSPLVMEGEDPATGSAAGPACAFLHRHGRASRVEITQGVEIGRPSVLRAEIDGERVRVSGDVVVVIEGSVRL